jgi:hypothetical protein
VLRSGPMNTEPRRRRDWKGERVLIGFRVAPDLRDELWRRAKAEGLSFGEYTARVLTRALNGCKP